MTVTVNAAMVASALLSEAGTATGSRALGVAALITWLLDAISGGYMRSTWIARGGLRRQRATGDRLGAPVVFGHFGMATTGLLLWAGYLATQWPVLGWLAIALLIVVIGLGISTVTLWTPFPARRGPAEAGQDAGGLAGSVLAGPAEDASTHRVTDDDLARALTDDVLLAGLVEDVVTRAPGDLVRAQPTHRAHLAALVPAGHGVAAIATILLAVLAAVSAAR